MAAAKAAESAMLWFWARTSTALPYSNTRPLMPIMTGSMSANVSATPPRRSLFILTIVLIFIVEA